MTAERLQKVLARAGAGSRRHIEELIREGRITINGRVAQLGDRADLGTESVKIDGRRISASRKPHHYILLNKPGGYMSTTNDPEGRSTLLDLLPARLHKGLVPVGRLDYATEGLILLTDDGDFAHHVAHPRYGCKKTYEVKVKGRPNDAVLDKLRRGVVIDGKRTAPAEIRPGPGHKGPRDSVENSWWTVILGEGRTRQIREMFGRAGHPVSRLRRVAIGPVIIAGLPRGAWRELTETEVAKLRKKTERPKAPSPRPKAARPKAARPKAARPKTARPKTARPKTARPKTARPKTARPKAPPAKAASPKPPRPKRAAAKTPRSRAAAPKTSTRTSRPSKGPGRGPARTRRGSARPGRRRTRD